MALQYGEPLNPRELAAFVAAAETGSMHGAADALEITQSAATKRIQSLERRLAVGLLERGHFGVRITDAGRLLYPEAKAALSALDRAAQVMVSESGQACNLRLAASYTIGEFLLPAWLAAFRVGGRGRLRPFLEINNSHGVLACIREGHASIGFIESLEPTDGLTAVTVLRDEIVAVVAPEHRWARRRMIDPQHFAGEPYLTREQGSGTRSVATRALAAVGVELEPVLEASSTQSLKRAVLDGGFTLISRLAVEAEDHAGSLRALSVSGVDLTRPLRAVCRRRPALVGKANGFWRWIETAAHAQTD